MQTPSVPTKFELVDGHRGRVISLDERNVVKNFLGKTAAEAYEMFCSDWTQVENRELPPQLILIIRSVVEYIRSNLSKFVVEEWDGHYLPHMQQQISRIERLLK